MNFVYGKLKYCRATRIVVTRNGFEISLHWFYVGVQYGKEV